MVARSVWMGECKQVNSDTTDYMVGWCRQVGSAIGSAPPGDWLSGWDRMGADEWMWLG